MFYDVFMRLQVTHHGARSRQVPKASTDVDELIDSIFD